jgi:hypothetical protein
MDFIDIEEYMLNDISTRTEHLDLTENCIEIGGNSTSFRGLLSFYLKTTIPKGCKIHLCHKCNNPNCSNPKHLYYGTAKENFKDQIESGTYKSPWEHKITKYGLEEAKKIQGKGDKSAGGKGNSGKPKTESHKKKISLSLKKPL